jgi:hypothetical protein
LAGFVLMKSILHSNLNNISSLLISKDFSPHSANRVERAVPVIPPVTKIKTCIE